jgi:hypothetical protein
LCDDNVLFVDAVVVDTGLIASCGDWSPNGAYFAVGGTPSNQNTSSGDPEQVNIYDQNGKVNMQQYFAKNLAHM